MARYLIQFSYTSDAISNMVKNPQDRSAVVRRMAESWGGKLEAFYYAFGEYDGIAIVEAPDSVTMAAISMAVTAGGAISAFKTTALISMEEAVEAQRKAGTLDYQPPAG